MTVIEAAIVGMRFRAGANHKLRDTRGGAVATLEREPGNKFDPSAVKVLIGGVWVGYVARDSAIQVAAAMDAGQRVRATTRRFKFLRIDTHYKGGTARPKAARPRVEPGLNDEVGL